MIHFTILIKRQGDEPAWPELNDTNSLLGDLAGCCLLDKGMASGKTSIAFRVETPHGPVIAQTSAAILESVAGALKGAEELWSGKSDIEPKSINDPTTVEALKHLQDIFDNARTALIDGKRLVLVSSIDNGAQYLNQDLFNEVDNGIKNNFINYCVRMLNKMR